MKFFTGLVFSVTDLVTFLMGVGLLLYGIRVLGSSGGGRLAQLLVEQIGRVASISVNLKLVGIILLLVGVALIVTAAGYALKALKEARTSEEGANGTIRHFSPME